MIWGRPELNDEAVYKMLEAASTRPQTLQTFVDGGILPTEMATRSTKWMGCGPLGLESHETLMASLWCLCGT